MRYVTGGEDARVVMAGVGSSARQAWPTVAARSEVVSFDNVAEMNKIPVQYIGARTDPTSKLAPSVLSGGRLVPQANIAPTYEHRLLDQTFDGAVLSIETIISSSLKTLALPSMLVVASQKTAAGGLIGVEYGSDGIRIVSFSGTTLVYEHMIPRNILPGSIIRVERFLRTIQVFHNGVRIASEMHSTFNLVGSPGVCLYSSTGSNTSTPIGQTTFQSFSSTARSYGGRGHFEKLQLPQSTFVNLVKVYVKGGRSMRTVLTNARWTTTTALSARNFEISLNGARIGLLGDQNGTALTTSAAFAVPENSLIEINASSNATPQDRVIASGTIDVIPA